MTQAFDRSQLAEPDGDGHDHHDDDGDADADQVGSSAGHSCRETSRSILRPAARTRPARSHSSSCRSQPWLNLDRHGVVTRTTVVTASGLPADGSASVTPRIRRSHTANGAWSVTQSRVPAPGSARSSARRADEAYLGGTGPAGRTSMAVPPPPGSPGVRPEPGTVPATAGAAGAA